MARLDGSFSMESDLAGMKPGESRIYSSGDSGDHRVDYEDEQALGDNNLPARGYRTGHYHVTNPQGERTSFRHSPHGPSLEGAKSYAARKAADHVMSKLREGRSRDVHPMNGRQGM